MNKMKYLSAAAILLIGVLGTAGCSKQINYLKARNELNRGVESYSRSNYSRAAEMFQRAIEYDSELLAARHYLAASYMSQFIPGSEEEENLRVANLALDGFRDVLEREPDNGAAIESIASLYFNMKQFDDSVEWYNKLLEQFPDKPQAYYTMGVISWTRTYQPRLEVRASLGMRPEDPGPIKDAKAREELAAINLPIVEEGLRNLEKAIEIDPDYDDAMAYVNLLYRELADISATSEEYEAHNATADDWVQKTLDTKKRKAEASTVEAFE